MIKKQGAALYIINSEGIVYHQVAEEYTLMRDEIQGRQFRP
jgi:hypothetical protein